MEENEALGIMAYAIGSADVGEDMMGQERRWIEGDTIRSEPWPNHYLPHAREAIEALKAAGYAITPPENQHG